MSETVATTMAPSDQEQQAAPDEVQETPSRLTRVCQRLKDYKQRLLPGLKVGLLISAALYVVFFVLGILNIKKCPVNRNIPLYLVVEGATGVVLRSLTAIKGVGRAKACQTAIEQLETVLYCVELVFFILGSYWVYSEYLPSFDPESEGYCDKTAYLVAFWFITMHYVIPVLLLFVLLVMCCALLFLMLPDTASPRKYDVAAEVEAQKALEKAPEKAPE